MVGYQPKVLRAWYPLPKFPVGKALWRAYGKERYVCAYGALVLAFVGFIGRFIDLAVIARRRLVNR